MIVHKMALFAPAADLGGAAPVAVPAEPDAGYIDETLPSRRHGEIDPFDDTDFVIEGDEGAMPPAEPPELAGKSREDILAQLRTAQEQIAAEKARADPVAALQQTLQQVLQPAQPKPDPVPGWQRSMQQQPGQTQPQETAEQRKARLDNLFLSDPTAAAQLVAREQNETLLMMMANNQAQISRELLLSNADQKKLYDRYTEEVEAEVAKMPPIERVQNPRVYQTAMERIKARHQDELFNENFEQRLNDALTAKLAELGITPGAAPAAPKKPVYSAAAGPGSRPPAPRTQIVIPRAVAEEAERQGLDPKFYYQHLKSQGRI